MKRQKTDMYKFEGRPIMSLLQNHGMGLTSHTNGASGGHQNFGYPGVRAKNELADLQQQIKQFDSSNGF